MAVLGRLLIASAERVDLPDLLSIDSFVAGDFKFLLKGLIGDGKPLILNGFDVINPGDAIGSQSISVRVADSVVLYPGSNAGPFFHGLPEGNTSAQPLIPELRKNATNYVYLTFSTFDTSKDTRAFWDPDLDGGNGGEFTQDINTESVLKADINVSTSSFPDNTIPVCKVVVGPAVIESIEDARDMMFRLGAGGLSPDPFNRFTFPSDPTATYKRAEPPTKMSSALDPNPFQGADKNFHNLKDWMDVVMTKLAELGGTTFWYEDAGSYNLVNLFLDGLGSTYKSKGQWSHSSSTPGMLTWSEDINLKTIPDSRDLIIRSGAKTLANEEVMYIPMVRDAAFNTGNISVDWFNGVNIVNGVIGSFQNLVKGDWVKKKGDPNHNNVRVEEFYANTNLTGGVTTPALARSIKISSTYLGLTETKVGARTKGVYTSSEVLVANRGDGTLEALGGNLHWLAIRSDTIMNVSNVTTSTITGDVTEGDGSTAKFTATAHGLVDGDYITIAGSTNYNGTYKVEVETANIFYIRTTVTIDEVGVNAYIAVATTTTRSTADGLLLESANHNFADDETIIIAGTSLAYDGSHLIKVRSATTFSFAVGSAVVVASSGTATLARVEVRSDFGLNELVQGETVGIGSPDTANILSYVGMGSLSQTHPTYNVPLSYNTLNGMENYNGTDTDNLTVRVAQLTAMMADKTQDKTVKFLPSGYASVTNTVNGANQDIVFNAGPTPPQKLDVILPGSANFSGTVGLTGTLSLPANSAAYIEVDRNAAWSYANLGFVTVAAIEDVPIEENTFVLAVRLATSEVWLWDGFYVSSGIPVPVPGTLDLRINQDRTSKLISGGTWDWDLGTDTLTWDAHAFIQVAGLANTVNQLDADSAVIASGEVAYVNINRAGPGGSLTVLIASIASVVLGADTVIVARRDGNDIVVGNHSMKLIDGESKLLYAGASDQTLAYVGAPDAASSVPVYVGPIRNITQGDDLRTAIDSVDTELDKFFGQLQLRPASPLSKRVLITGVDLTMLNASVLGQELVGLLMKFDGAQIDFDTGDIYEADGITPLGQNFTPATIAAGQYRYYSVSLIPNALDAQNRITAQVLVLPASADGASPALAPRAVFGGTKKLGQVYVQESAGSIANITQANCVQLGIGSGSGSGSASPKMIGGGTFSWDSGTNELSFVSDIYIEQARLNYADNTIDQVTVSPITLPTVNHVAYIERLNASSGGPDLTVLVDLITNVKDGQIIIARRDGSDVIVGSTSMRLVNGESKKLFAGVSDQLLNTLPASNNADYTGQLRLLQNTVAPKRVNVSAVSKTVPDGTEYGIQLKNLLLDFGGAQIDFDTGDVYEEDGITSLGINFTPATIAAGQYRWYSVTLLPNAVTLDNKITGQLLIIPASIDGASPTLAPKAAFASSGIQLGEVVVQESAGSITNILQNAIVQLSTAGSGSGSGDANELLERIKDRLINSPFEWAEPNIFLTDEDDKIGSATATFDVANTLYKFTGIGQNIVSIQSLDAEFLTEEKDLNSVELIAFWNPGFIDSNATYEVSRNGGVDWFAVTMDRVGLTTDTFRGILNFAQDTTFISMHEWALADATAYRELNATTLQAIGQRFDVASGTEEVLQRDILYINKVGSPVGYTYVQLVLDDGGGQPSTDLLDVVAQAQVLNSSLSAGDNAVTLTWGANIVQAGTYHYVIATDAAYKTGFSAGVDSVRARVDASAPIGPFGINELISSVWTANVTESLIYRIEGRPLDLRVRITSSATNVQLKGYGILYGRQAQVVEGIKNREVQSFDGTVNNYNTFTLSNFLPDPDLLKVYHVETGQVYRLGTGGFALNGYQVIFAADTFNGLGTVTLVFDQLDGTSFDNSDSNAALLAANFLGSTDASIDRSQNGRGLFLRRPDGTLREITIDNTDNIVVYSV